MVSLDSYSQYKPKPKSRDLFYSITPQWSDITPLPLIEGSPTPQTSGNDDDRPQQPAPALATIAYSQRYNEAMSYLRAVMAKNEFSLRSVALTEDIISMNPAHYTVWLFRMKCLKSLWAEGQEGVLRGVEDELAWLEGVSERNLKNYQIWHHRQTLVTLIPTLPPTEIPFLTHILSFDHKNYHVWTYRQWLCRQFPDPLLLPSTPTQPNQELIEMDIMIDDDIRNNSAWNHRYYLVFGAEELDWLERKGPYADDDEGDAANTTTNTTTTQPNADQPPTKEKKFKPHRNRKSLFLSDSINAACPGGTVLKIKQEVVDREIEYVKAKIEIAPQNPSAWNYLKGVLRRAGIPLKDVKEFCEGFVLVVVDEEREFEDVSSSEEDVMDVDQQQEGVEEEGIGGDGGGQSGSDQKSADLPTDENERKGEAEETDFLGDQVRSSHAVEWLAEIYALSNDVADEDGEGQIGTKRSSRQCFDALSQKWDPIRKNYWEYRAKQLGV